MEQLIYMIGNDLYDLKVVQTLLFHAEAAEEQRAQRNCFR
ncbi:hypothetical protein SAMN05444008_11050 [Cnuella takakiae]|uniref:Uncharacterized protein n=1 Tax=Cnuella takakiae TaxID=1302690 RepID=A0A1M5D2N4_9BACT|nr:hypothetical protein SAMN05444008_11050 [Cnuella takakiae]